MDRTHTILQQQQLAAVLFAVCTLYNLSVNKHNYRCGTGWPLTRLCSDHNSSASCLDYLLGTHTTTV